MPVDAVKFQVEFFFISDSGTSDQDGRLDCPYGACAFDNVEVWTEDDPPAIEWIQDPEDPFEMWEYPCEYDAVDDSESHLSGPITHLYMGRPNPFRSGSKRVFFCSLSAVGDPEHDR